MYYKYLNLIYHKQKIKSNIMLHSAVCPMVRLFVEVTTEEKGEEIYEKGLKKEKIK